MPKSTNGTKMTQIEALEKNSAQCGSVKKIVVVVVVSAKLNGVYVVQQFD